MMVLKDGFLFLGGSRKSTLVIESAKISESIDYISNKNIKKVALVSNLYSLSHLEFLKNCPNINYVNIVSSLVNDFSGLYYLSNLKNLYINYELKGELDLSLLGKLEDFAAEWSYKIKGLEVSKELKKLRLWKYKPLSRNLEQLSALKLLNELELTQAIITSLKGCGELPNLETLKLNYLRNFEYLSDIENNASSLKKLCFESCKKIKNHEYVAFLKKLEWLSFVGCGEIQSLGFIRELPNLKDLICSRTNVIDGDLTPCIGLEYVVVDNKKHYSHKLEDKRLIKR